MPHYWPGIVVSSTDVTSFYRGRLSVGNAQLLARIQALWDQVFDPKDPAGTLPQIGTIVGRWITGAQAGAAAEATRYLAGLISAQTGIPLAAIEPFAIPPGLVGSTASGSTMLRYIGQAPAVYFNRIGQGMNNDMAAASTLSFLNSSAASEPYRVANGTVNHNATKDKRYTGRCKRIIRATACPFCVMIADRGYIPSHADFQAHAHCRCTAEPRISSYATSKSAVRRGRVAIEGN